MGVLLAGAQIDDEDSGGLGILVDRAVRRSGHLYAAALRRATLAGLLGRALGEQLHRRFELLLFAAAMTALMLGVEYAADQDSPAPYYVLVMFAALGMMLMAGDDLIANSPGPRRRCRFPAFMRSPASCV